MDGGGVTRRGLVAGLSAPLIGMAAAGSALAGPRQMGQPTLADFGGVADDSRFDNAPALDAAMADASVPSLYVPPGTWYFKSRPKPITRPVEIFGSSAVLTSLTRAYSEPDPRRGLLTAVSGSFLCSRLSLFTLAGASGGCAIMLTTSGSQSPDDSVLEDLIVSTKGKGGLWRTAVAINGLARLSPLGVRGVYIRGCQLFASEYAACEVAGGVQVGFQGGGMFPAGGGNGRLIVTGSPQVNSHYVHGSLGYVGGLKLDNCQYVNLAIAEIAGDLVSEPTARSVVISGRVLGKVQRGWTESTLIDGLPTPPRR